MFAVNVLKLRVRCSPIFCVCFLPGALSIDGREKKVIPVMTKNIERSSMIIGRLRLDFAQPRMQTPIRREARPAQRTRLAGPAARTAPCSGTFALTR